MPHDCCGCYRRRWRRVADLGADCRARADVCCGEPEGGCGDAKMFKLSHEPLLSPSLYPGQ